MGTSHTLIPCIHRIVVRLGVLPLSFICFHLWWCCRGRWEGHWCGFRTRRRTGDARFEECGLGVVGECEVELLALVAETLTIGILGRHIEMVQLVEIVEEVTVEGPVDIRTCSCCFRPFTDCLLASCRLVACHCSSLILWHEVLFLVLPSRDRIWLANGQCLFE
jgi:hypothetical protein